ncbi:helicase HerA-like domain-containing protein [Nocardioides sp. 503]|uniref:helicase HerA-like domain-containing protein n=1 Tax=Nocardioides sp. 503 TaxID=2508326 RepID=UPI00106F6819|nr:helicase HerA-like domain-containing protein [Nocardioides sp. 503]
MTQTPEDAAPPSAVDGAVAQAVAPGYAFEGAVLELGGLMLDAETLSDVRIRIPLAMVNRHGLVAGATGTGKTKTLQLLAEQLSAQGVPVFAADIKGDLSGLATPGAPGDKITARAASVGQQWQATGFPVEYYALGGEGTGIPLRVTMSAFGPTLLSKVLGLNDTQESSLGLVFHYADRAGLPLLDLADLRAVVGHLTSDEGKADLKDLGGLSSSTAGVILRELISFQDQGADAFFGEPEFESADLLQVAADGRGLISLVELPNLQDRPAVFSTFLMWLLADLFHDLPEVGDIDKPKLVFFFDEAHLLFADASKDFLQQVAQTVRLIRSKGVGVFFVTQSPTDVPDEVLAQLGSRVQHQLRAHTPNDAKALKATVNTYPTSAYDDLGGVITSLGIGEAVVTVMNERGAPTPVAWTRLRAPESLMGPSDPAAMQAAVAASPRHAKYAEAVDRESAREKLAVRLEEGARKREAEQEAAAAAKAQQAEEKTQQRAGRSTRPRPDAPARTSRRTSQQEEGGLVRDVVQSGAFKDFMRTAAREIARGMFKTGRR